MRWLKYTMNELLQLTGAGFVLLALCRYKLAAQESPADKGSSSQQKPPDDLWRAELLSLRRRYLAGYIPAMLADWIMGAHIYALYQSFGYTMHDIALLFMVGFGSSLSFGTWISAAADRHGRRQGCLWYCVVYILSALANNSQQWPLLCLSRALGGIATSLLYSCYEAWLVDEHARLGLPAETLGPLFSQTTFYNAMSAIVGGLIAEVAADFGGLTTPFNVAVIPLLCSAIATYTMWRENYGQRSAAAGGMREAAVHVFGQPELIVVGCLSAVFEASMFVFIFMWTPSLEMRVTASQDVHYGLVFAMFMLWKMIGSCAYQLLQQASRSPSVWATVGVPYGAGAIALVVPVISQSFMAVLTACAVFEACVGWYWPMIAQLRALRIPEGSRVTTMALFRVPLNLLVVGCMMEMGNWSEGQTYALCAIALVAVMVAFQWTEKRRVKLELNVDTSHQEDGLIKLSRRHSPSSATWRKRAGDNAESELGADSLEMV